MKIPDQSVSSSTMSAEVLRTEPSAQGNVDLSKKPGLEVAEKQQIYNIRITLTSREYKNLEKGNFFILIR